MKTIYFHKVKSVVQYSVPVEHQPDGSTGSEYDRHQDTCDRVYIKEGVVVWWLEFLPLDRPYRVRFSAQGLPQCDLRGGRAHCNTEQIKYKTLG